MRRPDWVDEVAWWVRVRMPNRRPRFVSRWDWWIDPYWTVLCWRVTGRCLSCGLKAPEHKMGCSERPSGGQLYLVARSCPGCGRAVAALPGQTVTGCQDHAGGRDGE